jgi:hypothetical protein
MKFVAPFGENVSDVPQGCPVVLSTVYEGLQIVIYTTLCDTRVHYVPDFNIPGENATSSVAYG